jgi:flagellar motor switch protein FliN/FliY
MTTSPSAGSAQSSFSNALFSALVAAITEASGVPWLVAAVPDAPSTENQTEAVRVNLTFEGSLGGECLLQFRRVEAIRLASASLRETASEFGPEQSQALLKIVNAAMSELCLTLEPQYGAFTIQPSLASDSMPEPASVIEMTAGDDSGNRVSITLLLNSGLSQSLATHAQSAGTAEPGHLNQPPSPLEQVNLDLVMDVELNVTLRFGQRQLALREVLELTSGSVIELDRQVEEPVELLLEGKVIARGEAVVIDGNYGLRVTDVPQPVSSQMRR